MVMIGNVYKHNDISINIWSLMKKNNNWVDKTQKKFERDGYQLVGEQSNGRKQKSMYQKSLTGL